MTEEKKAITRKISLKNISILFSTLGVIILFIGFYFICLQLGLFYKNSVSMRQDVKKGFESSVFNMDEYYQQLHEIKEELAKQQQGVTEIKELHQSPNQWRVFQAQSLVNLANDQLQFSQDILLAQKLLQAASDEIKNLSDSKLEPVRKALTEDLARIEKIQPINIEETYSRLMGVGDKLNQLPLPQMNVQENQKKATEDLLHTPWWKQGLQQSWQSLQKIILIQHIDKQAQLLLPQNSEFLYQNLHAKLETAIWGLLHHQPSIYQTSLTQLMSWVKQYFIQDSVITKAVLNDLTELQKVNLQQPAVSVADSMKALKEYIESQSESITKNNTATH